MKKKNSIEASKKAFSEGQAACKNVLETIGADGARRLLTKRKEVFMRSRALVDKKFYEGARLYFSVHFKNPDRDQLDEVSYSSAEKDNFCQDFKYAIISREIPDFYRSSILKNYNLIEKLDTKNAGKGFPCVYFGCYTNEDFANIAANKSSLKILVYAGPDTENSDMLQKLRGVSGLFHVASTEFASIRLKQYSISHKNIFINPFDEEWAKKSFGPPKGRLDLVCINSGKNKAQATVIARRLLKSFQKNIRVEIFSRFNYSEEETSKLLQHSCLLIDMADDDPFGAVARLAGILGTETLSLCADKADCIRPNYKSIKKAVEVSLRKKRFLSEDRIFDKSRWVLDPALWLSKDAWADYKHSDEITLSSANIKPIRVGSKKIVTISGCKTIQGETYSDSIKYAYVSPSLYETFGKSFMEKYGLTDIRKYIDTSKPFNLPCVYFGCYKSPDVSSILLNSSKFKILVYGGTDATRTTNLRKLKRKAKDLKHVSISKYISEDLERLGISHREIAITPVDHSKYGLKPIPLGNSVYIYNCSHHKRHQYGADLYEEVVRRFRSNKNIRFEICGYNTFTREELLKVYERSFIGLRLIDHDGLPNTVIELGLMGRRTIHNGGLPSGIPYENVEDICRTIEEEYSKIGMTNKDVARRTKEHLEDSRAWLEKKYWKRSVR